MEGKLRIKSGIGRTQVGGETMTPNTKITRGKSAIGLGKFSKNYEKSRSPSKGLKKLNVNVNVNLNNGNNLPQINQVPQVTSQLTTEQMVSQVVPTTPNILNNSIKLNNSFIEKSPNPRILPTKFKIVTTSKVNTSVFESNSEEITVLKNKLQKTKAEVAFHKTERLKLEQEIKQKDKLIESLLNMEAREQNKDGLNPNQVNSIPLDEVGIIVSLKRSLKESQDNLKSREEEISKLKKLSKTTNADELVLENKTLIEELKRVKNLYDAMIISNKLNEKTYKDLETYQNTILRQENLILGLQEHNGKLMDDNSKKTDKIQQLKDKLKKFKIELENLNLVLNEKEKDLLNKNKSDTVEELKNLDEKRLEDLQKLLKEKDQEISTLNIKILNSNKHIELNYNDNPEEKFHQTEKLEEENCDEAQIRDVHDENKNTNSIDISNVSNGKRTAMTEDEFNELTYVLIKNFESRNLSKKQITELLEAEINEAAHRNSSESKYEVLVKTLMQNLNNVNPQNANELNKYWSYLGEEKSIKEALDKFLSEIGEIQDYSKSQKEFTSLLEQQLIKYRSQLQIVLKEDIANIYENIELSNEIKEIKDSISGSYISFFQLKKIFYLLQIDIEPSMVEFLIYILKKFDDPNSLLTDLKYTNILDLIPESEQNNLEITEVEENENTKEHELSINRQNSFNEKKNIDSGEIKNDEEEIGTNLKMDQAQVRGGDEKSEHETKIHNLLEENYTSIERKENEDIIIEKRSDSDKMSKKNSLKNPNLLEEAESATHQVLDLEENENKSHIIVKLNSNDHNSEKNLKIIDINHHEEQSEKNQVTSSPINKCQSSNRDESGEKLVQDESSLKRTPYFTQEEEENKSNTLNASHPNGYDEIQKEFKPEAQTCETIIENNGIPQVNYETKTEVNIFLEIKNYLTVHGILYEDFFTKFETLNINTNTLNFEDFKKILLDHNISSDSNLEVKLKSVMTTECEINLNMLKDAIEKSKNLSEEQYDVNRRSSRFMIDSLFDSVVKTLEPGKESRKSGIQENLNEISEKVEENYIEKYETMRINKILENDFQDEAKILVSTYFERAMQKLNGQDILVLEKIDENGAGN